MHRRTVSLFTAMLGLVMMVVGFGALSPSFTLYSVAYSGTTDGAAFEENAGGALRVDSASGFVGGTDLGRDDGVSYRYSADHSDRPTVSIKSVTPEFGEENTNLRVTLRLSRELTADEEFCYSSTGQTLDDRRKQGKCIEGGIALFDSYNDHLREDGATTNDGQVAFVFRGAEVEKRLTVPVKDDECITPNRTIKIGIYTPYQDIDEDGNGTLDPHEIKYGYDIDTTTFTLPVIGNDDDNQNLWPVKPNDYVYSRTNVNFCENNGTDVTEEGNFNRAPLFSGRPRVFDVVENTPAGQDIGDPVTAEDPENDTVTYSLTGTDASSFDINPSTGQILTKAALDFETQPNTYHLAVSVTDGKDVYGASNTAEDDSIDVTINVTDGNEMPEFDSGLPTTLNVAENTAAGVDIANGQFTATDPENDTLTYSLDDGDGAAFEIDANGQIKTKEALDHEGKSSYTVTVSVSDAKAADFTSEDPPLADDTHAVAITVGDANDAPVFEDENGDVQATTTRSVAENTATGQPVGAPVVARDDDNHSLTYSLTGTDAGAFDIDTGTGQIKVKDALDYEGSRNSYSVTVSVHDGKDDAGNTENPPTEDASIDVTINVEDLNEKPAFDANAPTTLEVGENTAADTDIGAPFTATDPDQNPSDTLTYSLGGTDAGSFDIDTSTGQVKTQGALDHEGKGTYSVEVQVSDGRDDAGDAEQTPVVDTRHVVTITVGDADDDGVITLTADPPLSGTTLTATLTDDDGVKSSPAVTWKWESSTDQINWTVIDGETTDSFTPGSDDIGDYLRVTATYDDELGLGKTAAAVSGAVLTAPATNLQPEFAGATATRSVVENTASGEPVGAPISATHADSKGTLVYSLDTTGATDFDIDSSTGQLKTKSVFDYETDTRSYTVTVSVSDGMNDYSVVDTAEDDSIEVTIEVTDENEKPAFADDAPATLTVEENTAADRDIGAPFTATDPDPSDTLTYSLGGTDSASFAIDMSTGQVKTKADLDHEGKETYSVAVQVSDGRDDSGIAENTPVVDTRHAVTITVTDADDQGEIALSTDPPSAGTVVTATLTDDDGVKTTPAVTWKWESSSDQTNWMVIDGETTNTYTPDTEDIGDYLQVTATYQDQLSSSDKTAEVVSGAVLTAQPTNLQPDFADPTTTRSVEENTAAGQNIGDPVAATHADSKGTLVYSLNTTGATYFDIGSSTGQLKTKSVFDYETDTRSYTVTVSVSDGMNDYSITDTVVDASIEVTINVEDENEKPAFADDAPVTLSVEENTAAGVHIENPFTATDPDPSDTLTYSLGGTDAAAFDVDTGTGQVKTKADLNHEGKETYSVVVQVSDGRDDAGDAETPPVVDTTHAVTITVTDADDPGVITLSTDPPSAGNAVTASLTDDDGVKTDVAVTWQWERSDDGQNNWAIISDATTDSYRPGTDDIGDQLRVTATYDDEYGSGKTAEKVSDAVTDRQTTNIRPEFDAETAARSVIENTPAGTEFGDAITASDGDDSSLTYSLGGTDVASFEYDTSSNKLKTKAALDYESGTISYSVTLSVNDGKDPWDNANTAEDDSIVVTINVIDMVVPAVPGAPTVEATPGAAAGLTVKWTALTATGTVPVDGYDVQYREKDANPTDDWTGISVTGASATITGLAYRTTYEVQVRSKNSEGESAWSPTGEGSIPSRLNVTFDPASRTVDEGNSATFTVTIPSPGADRALSIQITLSSSNAESGDYSPTSTTVSFASGDTSKTFTVSTTDDSDRSDETVNIRFGPLPAAVGTGAQSTATLTINDTTPAPSGGGGGGGGKAAMAAAVTRPRLRTIRG